MQKEEDLICALVKMRAELDAQETEALGKHAEAKYVAKFKSLRAQGKSVNYIAKLYDLPVSLVQDVLEEY